MTRVLRTADTGGTRIAMPQQSEEPHGKKSTQERREHSSFLQLFLEATRDDEPSGDNESVQSDASTGRR